jgi:hypothetical protein
VAELPDGKLPKDWVKTSVLLLKQHTDRLDALTVRTGLGRSTLIRQILDDYFARRALDVSHKQNQDGPLPVGTPRVSLEVAPAVKAGLDAAAAAWGMAPEAIVQFLLMKHLDAFVKEGQEQQAKLDGTSSPGR